MLSDSIRQMRELFKAGHTPDQTGFSLMLKAYELEARNMEGRILLLTGQDHVPLDGSLVSGSTPIIDIQGVPAT